MTNDTSGSGTGSKSCGSAWTRWLVLGGLLVLGIYLLEGEHRVHVIAALPFLFFLACPLMHLFMHGGHGGTNSTRQP
jgi:hypothetical protein